ncbi:hypothetical protein SADUNF_Sadunf01G0085600 [Salix dunnii]|uniref:WAT1-related protein n=1 Tax=Salix dunnii TaxID=1413687 RepID=A0A835TMQ3_9ROSI|nr:hypothetical protein SADUNF_Sadunf01G0085600 [Salix dunnii]
MERICGVLQGLKPALLMVLVQVAFAAVNVLYKLAPNDGMNLKIIVAYRFIFATAFMAPLAFIVERFVHSLNLIKRMEGMELGSTKGKAKATGTLMGIGGAMLLTFYEGVEIYNGSAKVNLLPRRQSQLSHAASSHGDGRILGFFMALLNCLSYSSWLILQGLEYGIWDGILDSSPQLFRILGTLLIICGLYFVLWGKSKEMKAKKQLAPSETETSQEDGIIVTSPTKDNCSDTSRVDTGNNEGK